MNKKVQGWLMEMAIRNAVQSIFDIVNEARKTDEDDGGLDMENADKGAAEYTDNPVV